MSSSGKRLAAPLLLSAALHATVALVAGWIIVSRQRGETPPQAAPATSTIAPAGSPEKISATAPSASAHALQLHQQAVEIRTLAPSAWMAPTPQKTPTPRDKATAPLTNFFQSVEISPAQGIHQGLGSTAGGMPLSKSALPAPQFLGTPITGEKILLLFDVSRTVANAVAHGGMHMEKIREETARLIEQLGIHTRFGLLQFARNYALFRPELAVATDANRREALQWLARYFGTEGVLPRNIPNTVSGSPGFLVALEHAFRLDPDWIFVLSDGNFQRGTGVNTHIPWEELEALLQKLQKQRPIPAKIHFMGVAVKPETSQTLRRILAAHHGTYSDLSANKATPR